MPIINGTPGPDTLNGTSGDDTINGLAGNDTISDGDGNDVVDGGDGDDRIIDGLGRDTLRGGSGFDTFELRDSNILIDGGINFGRVIVADLTFSVNRPTSFLRGADGQVFVSQLRGNQVVRDITSYQTFASENQSFTTYHLLDTKDDIGSDGDSDVLYYSRMSGELGYAGLGAENNLVTNRITSIRDATFGQSDTENVVVQSVGYVRILGETRFNNQMLQPDPDFIFKNTVTGAFFANFYHPSQIPFDLSYVYGSISLGVTDINLDVVTMADTDGDLVDEIIWRDSRDGTITISKVDEYYRQLSVGGSSFGALGTNWNVAGAGDFDNDGDEDILLRNDQNGQVYIYYMQNGAKSGSAAVNTFGADWIVQGVGDFNNDYIADVALKNTVTGQFYLLLMNATGSYAGSSLGIIGTDWNIVKTGDYNGDGTDDLLWRNTNSNQIYLWAMQDGHQAATGSAPYGYLTADQIIV
jgi:RTX calcium-binding nonapeptide repeat (4 copies)/FG-GAP repeat